MSSTGSSQPPRRRRIAGERRTPSVPEAAAPAASATESPVVDASAPPSLTHAPGKPKREKRPKRERAPKEPRKSKQSGPASAGGWWGSRASLLVLAATLVVLLAVTGLGLAGLLGNGGLPEIREAAAIEDAEQTAPSIAERAAETILAYDYRSLDGDQDAAERFMTPAFVKKYSDSFTKAVAPAARTYKAQVTSEVLGSSVVRATPDRVRVLVFVDQTTVATNKKTPQQALNRVEFDLVLRGGSWLVDNITSY